MKNWRQRVYEEFMEEGPYTCPDCGQGCKVIFEDDSFDHEFGTERRWHFVSACCEEVLGRRGQ